MLSSEESDIGLSQVGDYALDSEIGKGSFALVYRAHHTAMPHQLVAVKSVIRSKLSSKLLENLEGEISILKSMRHTNIVDLRDCLYTDQHIHLIMEYCPGGDLSMYIHKHGQVAPWDGDAQTNPLAAAQRAKFPHPEYGGLNEHMVRSFLAQLVSAVRFLRSGDIVHRDIKPQNLLLQIPDDESLASGHPREIPLIKVADFGFARNLPAASLAKTLCGSPLYMAPEILRYEKYDAKADLWSVGAVLYEMCVGKPPFRASNHVELLRRIEHSNDRIKFPDERSEQWLAKDAMRRQLNGEAPRPPPPVIAPDIKALIRRLLKRHPVERMSFDELFADPVVTHVPYSGHAIIKDQLAASVHLAHLPADIFAPPKPPTNDAPLPTPHTPDDRPPAQPSALSRAMQLASQRHALTEQNKPASLGPEAPPPSLLSKPMSAPSYPGLSYTADEGLLPLLQTLAKKAYVLIEFADTRHAEVPPSPLHLHSYSPAGSSPNSTSAYLQEVAGAESLALYIRSLSLLQRGLEYLNAYAERSVGSEPPEQLRDLTQWFRVRFDECYHKSLQARSNCHTNVLVDPAQHIDRLIFDKALELARMAALDELEGNKQDTRTWDPTHCIMAYETALHLLMGLLDPTEDRMNSCVPSTSTVETFLKSITKRLAVLHGRGGTVGPTPTSAMVSLSAS